jgi:hypothetical protein
MATRLSALPPQLATAKAKLAPYAAQPGETFYGFIGGSAIFDVGTTLNVIVQDEDGGLAIGVNVYNVRPDGKFEVFQTDGQGKVQFLLGPGAKFSPDLGQEGPHTVFVSDAASSPADGLPSKIISDKVGSMGLPYGHHCDYSISFRRMKEGSAPPPPPPPLPPGQLTDAINHLEQALAILRNLKT